MLSTALSSSSMAVRARSKDSSDIREGHAARGALQQLRAQLRLQFVDAPAQGRLRQMEILGGRAEAGAFRHRHEGLQFLEIEIDAPHALIHP